MALALALALLAAAAPARAALIYANGFETGFASWSTSSGAPALRGGMVFLATLTPQSAADTLGAGQATLVVAPDASRSALRFTLTNLTGPLSAAHIHAPDGQILFDIDAAAPQPDGSRTWIFGNAGAWTRAQIEAALLAGQCYVNLHTGKYPAGEIKGFLHLADGSSSFTPPPAPPALPPGPPDAFGAARFLRQASLGPTLASIAQVQSLGYGGWIDAQLAQPLASHLAYVDTLPGPAEDLFSGNARESIWKQMIQGPDQLRQRMAFALSELLVASDRDDDLFEVDAIASYMDILDRDALGNFRTLLEDVTLSPAMGVYLDMASNDREDPETGRNPNENFARELLQLFSIGLYELQPDGTLRLGDDGLPLATYDQDTVRGFAKVFTGWTFVVADHSEDWRFYWPDRDYRNAMEVWPEHHSTAPKPLLGDTVLPGNGTAQAELDAALDNVFQHPNVGPFVCKHLIQRLVTSNPSPAYVYRCAQVFANDGSAVRGNLAAVARAILLDWEARSTTVLTQPGYGKGSEPVVRFVALLRALHAQPPADGRFRWYWIDEPAWGLGQMPLASPTVFNFFDPSWSQPGAVAQAGLASPELQLADETSVFGTPNFLHAVLFDGYANDDTTITLDWDELDAAAASGDAALLDTVNLLFYAGRMSAETRAAFVAALADPDFPTAASERAQTVVWLVSLTPEFVAGS